MRARLVLSVLAIGLLPGAAHAADACVAVVPGKSIGPIRIGVKSAELRKLKLKLNAPSRSLIKVGELYEAYLDDKSAVTAVSIDLNKVPCLLLGNKRIDPKRTPEGVALQVGSCEPMEPRDGGNVLECQGRTVMITWNPMHKALRVVTPEGKRPAAKELCDIYLAAGSHAALADKDLRVEAKRAVTLPIERGKRYCRYSKVITQAYTEADVFKDPARSCATRKQVGATIVSCDYTGIRYTFAGPKGVLTRVELFTPKK